MDAADLTPKLLLVGGSGVGKSSLLLRFTDGAFEPYLKPTIGNGTRITSHCQDARKETSAPGGLVNTHPYTGKIRSQQAIENRN